MPRFALVFAVCLAVGPQLRAQGKSTAFEFTPFEKQLIALTNVERKKENLPPVTGAPALGLVARAHSSNMADKKMLEHVLDGKSPFDRLRAAKYNYKRAGENIAFAAPALQASDIIKGWMDSKGHRANIMQPEFNEIGIGVIADSAGDLYITQIFGRPRTP